MIGSDKTPRAAVGGIPIQRLVMCMVVSVILGAFFGLVGSVIDWSEGVAFGVVSVVGAITCVVTLYTDLFDRVRLPNPRRHARHHA